MEKHHAGIIFNVMRLIIFGNTENLIPASRGASAHMNPFIPGGLSRTGVVTWLLIAAYARKVAIRYADCTEIIGAVAIINSGMESMLEAVGIV